MEAEGQPEDRTELLRTAIGPKNTDYYLERFRKFEESGSRISWNWPAFFVSFYWMLYRKMWLYSIGYLVSAWLIYLVVLFAALPFASDVFAAGAAQIANLGFMFVIFPIFANRLYYRIITKRVALATEKIDDPQQQLLWLARKGGTTHAAWIVLLAVVFVGGMLAAIAIPAYQDYTIRAQVAEGLNLAVTARTAVTETIFVTGEVPANRVEAGMTPEPQDTSGNYVRSVDVINGRIDITYGEAAHPVLAGQTLSVTPYAAQLSDDDWQIVWRCGSAPAPPQATHEIAPYSPGSLASLPQYLPSACRP